MASPVVTPEWLSSQIEARHKDLRIFDTTIGPSGPSIDEFMSAHIEGAQFFNVKKNAPFTQYLPLGLPDPADFQDYVRSLGINASSHVILYENVEHYGFAASRAWWLLRVHGITNVSLLSGGLGRWKKEGHPVTDKQVDYEKGDVTVKVNKSLVMLYDDIKPGDGRQFVDTRHADHFNGKEKEPSAYQTMRMELLGLKSDGLAFQTGHIAGAVNIHYTSLYQDDTISFKGKDELLKVFQCAGVKLDRPMSSTCYIGFTACALVLAACVCGKDDVSVYYGSWTEYGQRAPDASVEC
ncbi:thiosulfate sulfurtransferase-like isoform X1 [Haliotis rufescens]|uniref:thiosulfate sulfurtransferase-like isoform X1 n=1 Tax=Haliotis rufescens TaxID=6454 RepID=UPI00201EE2A6|nr:thiosulfate sulfurtransferase-like isoform X1 [Haliotis rufescens]